MSLKAKIVIGGRKMTQERMWKTWLEKGEWRLWQ